MSGQLQGGLAMGIGHALHEYLPLYEDGPGDGTWNFNRYTLPRATDVAVWKQTGEVLPALSDTDPPKGMAEVVMIAVVPAIVNAIAHAIGQRFRELPVTAEKVRGTRSSTRPRAGAAGMSTTPAKLRPLSLQINGSRHGPIDVPEGMMMVDCPARVPRPHRLAPRLRPGRVPRLRGDRRRRARPARSAQPASPARTTSTASASAPSKATPGATTQGEIVELSPVQQAFLDHFSFQCGYCTPGFVNAATVLLERLQQVADRRETGRGDDHRGAEPAPVPLHRLRALLPGGEGRGADHARPGQGRQGARAMTRVGWKRILAWLVLIVLVVLLIGWSRAGGPTAAPVQQVQATPEQIERGRYLADAADCAGCHTAPTAARRSPAAFRCIRRSAPFTAPTSRPTPSTASAATAPTISSTR